MATNFKLPALYSWFFLFIEPVSALVGAYFANFKQADYLSMTHLASSPASEIPLSTSIVLTQLANLYLLFAINEAVSDIPVCLEMHTSSEMWRWCEISMPRALKST